MSDKVIANERRRSHRAAGQGDLHEAFLEAVRARDDAHNETERLRARVEVLEQLARESLHVLACREEDDDPGHWCVHCDEYVDRNGTHRSALRAALEATP
jgi:hypothetical protein